MRENLSAGQETESNDAFYSHSCISVSSCACFLFPIPNPVYIPLSLPIRYTSYPSSRKLPYRGLSLQHPVHVHSVTQATTTVCRLQPLSSSSPLPTSISPALHMKKRSPSLAELMLRRRINAYVVIILSSTFGGQLEDLKNYIPILVRSRRRRRYERGVSASFPPRLTRILLGLVGTRLSVLTLVPTVAQRTVQATKYLQ